MDHSKKPTPEMLEGSFNLIQRLFKQVAPMILERAGKVASFTDKTDGSPVTDTDVEVEKIVQAEVAKQFPSVPVFGEEGGYGENMPEAYWLIDPIDGTKSFIENSGSFTSMAVLIENNQATAAIIYNPSTNDMFTAQKGKGAFQNGTRINLAVEPLPPIAICKKQFIDEINTMLAPKNVTCEPAPSGGGFGFTMVLDGRAAARYNLHSGGYTHDYAPGALLVAEAGGAIIPILEDSYTFETRSFVACHPDLASVVTPHIQKLREFEALRVKK